MTRLLSCADDAIHPWREASAGHDLTRSSWLNAPFDASGRHGGNECACVLCLYFYERVHICGYFQYKRIANNMHMMPS
jgi:hypothetical protein